MTDAEFDGGPVSVVIVNFNGGDLLTACVCSVLASTVPVEVIVSDNHSTDDSLAVLRRTFGDTPRLRIVENGANLGFARANNAVLPMTTGRFLLFLNPDCIIQPDAIARMYAVMKERPEAGMAGCLIRNLDGSEQPGCRRYVPTPWRSFVRVFRLSRIFRHHPRFSSFVLTGQPLPARPTPVEAISGAFMFVRRSALNKVGLLDEDYFLHCEDLDWCMRFRQAGFSILFVPDVEIIHAKGVGSAGRPIYVEWHKHRGMILFYRKFFRHAYPTLLLLAVTLAVWARFASIAAGMAIKRLFFSVIKEGNVAPIAVWPVPAVSPSRPAVIVTGATSQVGYFLIPRLLEAGYAVDALSRTPQRAARGADGALLWHEIDIVHATRSLTRLRGAQTLIHLAPLATLPDVIDVLVEMGIKNIVAFGSTSRYSKLGSADPLEQKFVRELIQSEEILATKCAASGVAWTLFRPTLIYGCGKDKNVTTIARFIRRFGFFPLPGEGIGLRQPVHADDLAQACMAVLQGAAAMDRTYNLSGGETLTYRQMVEKIFEGLQQQPRIVKFPLSVFSLLLALARLFPAFRHINLEMVTRINLDLNFDHAAAQRDFGYAPRPFKYSPNFAVRANFIPGKPAGASPLLNAVILPDRADNRGPER